MMAKRDLSRRDFLKGAAIGTVGITTVGMMTACSSSGGSTGKEQYIEGTYTSTETTGFATIEVTCTFSKTALTDVSYKVIESSDSDYFQTHADAASEYCKRIVEKGSTVNVDGISGATLSGDAIKRGVNNCIAQALGINLTAVDSETAEINPQDESYDTYTTDFSAIFTPIQVGHMKLRNRIAKSSAGSDTQPSNAKEISENAVEYYGRFADGGAALVLLETPTLRNFGFNPGDDLAKFEANKSNAIKIAERVHKSGAYIGYQVGIGSPIEEQKVNVYTNEEIKQMVVQYAEIGRRLKESGFDCIEIKGATADGLNAFLSRRQNQREDEYGPQSLENRARFFVEMIKKTRELCGKDFSILALINAVEENDANLGQNEKYLTIEETKEIAKLLEQAGADAIQVRVGTPGQEITCWAPDCSHAAYKMNGATGFGTIYDYSTHFGGMLDGSHSGVGTFLPAAKAIKEAVKVPVGCAGYMDPRTAPDLINNAIAKGDIDLIFMNRPLTVDPQLPNKLQAKKREEVAPCTRCLHCHGRPYGEPETCRVNATTQFAYTDEMPEGYEPLPAKTVKNVMVIGGGPAGMEAARVAAERGHKVTLFEEKSTLGGLLEFAAGIKGKHERLADLRAYLIHQLDLKGVTVVTGQKVDEAFVKEKKPDVVITAVGGLRDRKLTDPKVISIEDVLGGRIGEKVVILGAGAQAIDVASYLVAKGRKIQIVHEGTVAEIDKEQSYWVRKFVLPHLYAKGVKIWNNAKINGIVNGALSITTDVGLKKNIECDTIIECYDMLKNTALYDALVKDGFETYAVGDCAEPFNIQKAIHAGHIVARKI